MATPMAQSIFAAPTNRNKPLVEFRAGKMLIRGKMVIPDKRKGKIEVNTSPDDQLMHFKWKDRSTGQVETDLIIFPDEAVFKKVKQCTTGRVYLLEWKSTERRLFFWMQEPSDEKDAELCEKVNKALNNPPSAEGEAGAGGMPGLGGMSQEQLLAMMGMGGLGGLGGMGGGGGARRGSARGAAAASAPPSGAQPAAGGAARSAAPTPSTPAPTSTARSAEASIGEQQLQNILRELGAAQTGGGGGAGGGQAAEDVDLSSVMTSEALLPLLSNPAVAEQLLPYLPEGQRNPEELRELVRSPQFHQALQAFNSALQSGALASVLPALGLPASAGGGGVQDFLRALQEQSQRQQGGSSEGGEKKDESKDGSGGGGGGGGKKDGDNMDTS